MHITRTTSWTSIYTYIYIYIYTYMQHVTRNLGQGEPNPPDPFALEKPGIEWRTAAVPDPASASGAGDGRPHLRPRRRSVPPSSSPHPPSFAPPRPPSPPRLPRACPGRSLSRLERGLASATPPPPSPSPSPRTRPRPRPRPGAGRCGSTTSSSARRTCAATRPGRCGS